MVCVGREVFVQCTLLLPVANDISVCYKLLEHLALQHISPTIERLLSPDQAGFRKGRSTCDQVAALPLSSKMDSSRT